MKCEDCEKCFTCSEAIERLEFLESLLKHVHVAGRGMDFDCCRVCQLSIWDDIHCRDGEDESSLWAVYTKYLRDHELIR